MRLALLFCILLVTRCDQKSVYWNISKFTVIPSALAENEEVKVIYVCDGPNYNQNKEYYIHLIVVSQKSGDTVNVLSPVVIDLSNELKNKVFNYFSENNVYSKLFEVDLKNIENIKNFDELTTIQPKRFEKVARNPEYDAIADNSYPSVFGTLGVITTTGK